MGIGFNPVDIFRLAPGGISGAGGIMAATQDVANAAARAAEALPKGPGGGVQVPRTKQEIPIVEDALVLSDAMLQIFDGGKLVIGEARTLDKELDRKEFDISNFAAVDLDKSGKLSQAEVYIMLLKAGPARRKELLEFLNQSGEKAGKINSNIKWIARGVTAVDIASVLAVWVMRFAFNIFSMPLAAVVSVVPPILAQFFGAKGIEKQIDKMNGLRGDIAQAFNSKVASAQ